MKALFHTYLTALAIVLASTVSAANDNATQQLKSAVLGEISERYQQNMPLFNPAHLSVNFGNALKLFNQPVCPKTLEFDRINILPLGNQRLLIKCTAADSWSIYLPVYISYLKNVVTTRSALNSQKIISDSDLTLTLADISKIRGGYFTELSEATGQSVKRNIRPGSILNPLVLQAPEVIKRGDLVQILARSSSLTVKMQGYAMTSGRLGKQIQVKNARSGKVVKARVVDKGLVEVII